MSSIADAACPPRMGCGLIAFVSQPLPSAPADRLALIIEGLCVAVARRLGLNGQAGPRLAGPFIILVWSRLRRIKTRFASYALTPIPSRPQAIPKAAIAIGEATKQSRTRPKSASTLLPRPLLPRNRAWLLRLVPETASGASQLRYFLADPEVTALLTTAPKLQSILRPLCHMLGIRAAGIRAAGVRPAPAPPPSQPPDVPPAAPHISRHAPRQAVPIVFPPGAPPLSPEAPPPTPLHILA
jgi:hypothetical protein